MISIKTQDFSSLIEKLTSASASEQPISASDRDMLFNETLAAINAMAESPSGEERSSYVKDFCATYDDLGAPIKSLLTSDKVNLSHEQKQQIADIFIRRYFSHEPGGRTGVVKALVDQDSSLIPSHLIEPLIKRAANATLDRTFLQPWDKHVELLGKLLGAIALDNFELQGIIQLRLEELGYDERSDVRQMSKTVFEKWRWLKIEGDKSSVDFLRRWKFVLSLVNQEGSIDALLDGLADVNPWVRSATALVFGHRRNSLATTQLLEHVARDVDEYVRLRCAWAIGQAKDGTAFWPLIHLRKYENVHCVRFAITDAIAQLDQDRAIELLLDDLADDNPSIRLFGAEDIRKISWPTTPDVNQIDKTLSEVEKIEPLLSVRRAASETLNWARKTNLAN